MSSIRRTTECFATLAASAAFLVLGPANAATLTFEFSHSFGDPADPGTAPPNGGTPWLTALFDDGGSPGSVTLTLTVGAIGTSDIDEIYFNLDPAFDPANLTFTRTGGTGPTAAQTTISTDSDNSVDPNLQADGDGVFDILFDFDNSPQSARFNAGETLTYDITGIASLDALSFNFESEPSLNPLSLKGPFLAAAKVLDTGTALNCQLGADQCSDWIAPPIPVPPAVWLFASAIGLLGWMRRKAA